jgi:tetratricopeptide (TPR) repeat protein
LGHTQLLVGDHFNGHWGRPRDRGMLGALLLRPRQPVPQDDVVDWVWPPDAGPRQRASTLDTYASRIRKFLKLMDRPPGLHGERGSYVIDIAREDVDVFEFRGLLDRAKRLNQQNGHAEARGILLSIVDGWSNPLADLDGDKARNWRRTITRSIWLPAQCELMSALSALGEFDDVLRVVDDLPDEYQTDLLVLQRKLEALHYLRRGREATEFFQKSYNQLIEDGDLIGGDALISFSDKLPDDTDVPVVHPPGPRVPRHIPHDVPGLVGRAELLDQLDATTSARAIVTLEGQPGVGKTALATRWAHRAAERFPDGQFWANLNGGNEGQPTRLDLVVDKFLTELGVGIDQIRTAVGRATKLRELLFDRRAVVILDNVASTKHVWPLLEALPCAVVVIGRRQLTGLQQLGARNLPVPPLRQPEAARWLADRIGPRAITEPGEVTTLVELCGGIALALHLVAEHMVRSPRVPLADFVDELRDPATLLELGDDTDNPTGSVGAALSTAYRALAPAQRRLFTLLGVHAGTDFSVAAAAAIAGQEERAVRHLLDDLVKAYLLTQPEARGRYRFHDLIGSFAALRVADDEERAAAEERMLNFYFHGAQAADAKIFGRLTKVPDIALLDHVLNMSFHDTTAALIWCTRERESINLAISIAGQNGFHDYATLLPQSIGEIFLRLGYVEDTMAGLNVAIETAESTGNLQVQADSHHNIGHALVRQCEFESARFHLTMAQRLYTEAGDQNGTTTARYNLAWLQVEQGEYQAGIDGLNEALSSFRELGDRGAVAKTLFRLANAYRRSGRPDEAVSRAQDGRWLAEEINDEVMQGDCLCELSAAYLEKGDWVSAKGYAERSLAITVRTRSLVQAAQASTVLAIAHREQGDPAAAMQHLRSAANLAKGQDRITEAAALRLLAEICFKQALHEEAINAASAALAIFEDTGDSRTDSARSLLNDATAALPIATPEQSHQTPNLTEPRIGSAPAH